MMHVLYYLFCNKNMVGIIATAVMSCIALGFLVGGIFIIKKLASVYRYKC